MNEKLLREALESAERCTEPETARRGAGTEEGLDDG